MGFTSNCAALKVKRQRKRDTSMRRNIVVEIEVIFCPYVTYNIDIRKVPTNQEVKKHAVGFYAFTYLNRTCAKRRYSNISILRQSEPESRHNCNGYKFVALVSFHHKIQRRERDSEKLAPIAYTTLCLLPHHTSYHIAFSE